jgi:hypothetical protein
MRFSSASARQQQKVTHRKAASNELPRLSDRLSLGAPNLCPRATKTNLYLVCVSVVVVVTGLRIVVSCDVLVVV